MTKQAKVAKVIDEFKVVVNIGARDGVALNQDFIIYRVGDEIIDPDTGEDLGLFEEVIGRGVITQVQEKYATLQSSEIREGGQKIIRKPSPYSRLSGMPGLFGPSIEEIVDLPDAPKPFKNAQVGDFVKQL